MTALLWTVLALIIIFAIARYNSSNKLFWELVTAYFIGMGLCYCANKAFFEEESVIEDNVSVKASPMQGLGPIVTTEIRRVTTIEDSTSEPKKVKPASRIKMLKVNNNHTVISNEVKYVSTPRTNGITYNPPIKLCYTHTSTQVDSHITPNSLAYLSINL